MRSILIKAVFYNGKTRRRGIYNPVNAEYLKSRLSYDDMLNCISNFENDLEGKRVKEFIVINQVSTGDNSENWEKCEQRFKRLIDISACKLVDINHILYKPFLK